MDLIADLKMFLQDPSGKYGVIRNLYENADTIFIPSGDVNTLKAASGKGSAVENVAPEVEEESEGEVDPKLEKAVIIGSITVAIIILTGIIGNVIASTVCKVFRIEEPIAKGLAIGTAAHAIGTARALEMGPIEGAMSSLAVAVAGILTAFTASLFAMLL